MTIEQRIQWIALPGGANPDGSLLLSIFIAPRLRTDGPPALGEFPDFVDWPARIRNTNFSVKIGSATFPAEVSSESPDSALWSALFSPQTPLTPYAFDDYADRPFVTYSVLEVLNAIRTLYANVASNAPDDLPNVLTTKQTEPQVRGLVDFFSELRSVIRGPLFRGVHRPQERARAVGQILQQARNQAALRRTGVNGRGGSLIEPLVADGKVSRHFERALLFHSRSETKPEQIPDVHHYEKSVDFHQMLSAISDHPWLLRRLGLVIDLELPASKVPLAGTTTYAEVSVQPNWSPALLPGTVDVLPSTAYAYQIIDGSSYFGAVPRNPDASAPPNSPPIGLVPLHSGPFMLEQVDFDGAILKTLNLTATLDAIANRPDPQAGPLNQPDQAGVPTIRTSGMALIEAGRAASLQTMFSGCVDLNAAIESNAPITLFAEELVRGYRLDIFDMDDGSWRSLHERVVSPVAERFAGPLPAIEDEGFLQLSLTGPVTPANGTADPNSELYVHENLVTWDGWSLSAPRPGKALSRQGHSASGSQNGEDRPSDITNAPLTAMRLKIETHVKPGSLPRLRFGRRYRVRMRTVNLAGGGPSLKDADNDLSSSVTPTPTLPAGQPIPYLRFEPVSAPTLVPAQRFGEGASLCRLVIRSRAGMTPDQYAASVKSAPMVTKGEHPGYLGHDDRHVAPPKAAFEFAERHGLFDSVIGSDGSPLNVSRRAEISAAYEIARREKGSFDDPSVPTAELVAIDDGGTSAQHYVVRHDSQLELPYLPDPLATGAIFFGLPGQPADQPLEVDFDGNPWYRARPFRLRLVDGDGAPEWDGVARTLTVHLPQATSAKVRICSRFGGDLQQMGMLQWCQQALSGADFAPIYRAAKANRSWLVTPWHVIELVHAVQQPLTQPEWVRFEVVRGPDQTWADLFGEIKLHVASTEKVDLEANWSETVDDLAKPGPELRRSSAVVFDLRLQTAARGRTDIDPHEIPFSLRDNKVLTFFTARAGQVEPHQPTPHRFGDTRYRRVQYRAVATSAYRENFPAKWSERRDPLTRPSLPKEVDVLSTAPPAPPKVLYVMPTQRWETSSSPGTTIRKRYGGGLRVYLDRPWFSSGEGELLGVIVGGSVNSPKAADYPYVTLFGQDPVRGGAPIEAVQPNRFRNSTLIAGSIETLDLQQRVTVIGHTPVYDVNTRRWFCDLDLETGDAYMPFIRLALARYQPHAIKGCCLSHIVLADIVQTLPDRTLTVARNGSKLDITLTGVSYTSIRGIGSPRSDDVALGRATARLYLRDDAIQDEFLGWKASEETVVVLDRDMDGINATWTGEVTVPSAAAARWRLVIVEEEHLATDDETGGIAARIIYADSLEI